MWPLDRSRPREWIRIGRHGVERWSGPHGDVKRVMEVRIKEEDSPREKSLIEGVRALLSPLPPLAPVAVIESAWMPTLLLDLGGSLLSPKEVEAFLRHRLDMTYKEPHRSTIEWDIRAEHRAGSQYAIGFGIPTTLRNALLSTAEDLRFRWSAMVPALGWGWAQCRPDRALVAKEGWWVWEEQDRHIIACLAAGQIKALNPAGDRATQASTVEAAVDRERARWGVGGHPTSIHVNTWEPSGIVGGGRVTWAPAFRSKATQDEQVTAPVDARRARA